MHIRKFLRLGWVGAVAATGVLGAAYAQSGNSATGQPPAVAGTTTQDQIPTMGEMVDRAIKMTADAHAAGQNVSKMLSDAREKKDVVKVLCLDDKVNQIDVAARAMDERTNNVKAAVAANDQEGATHHYTILIVLKDRVVTITSEANQCIGVEAGYVGATKVTVSIDPNIPTDPSEDYNPTNPVITVPPSCVSCSQ